MTIKINHIAIATNDMAQGERFWGELLGLPLDKRRVVEDEGVEVAYFRAGESHVELVRPIEDNGVQRFIDKRGAGIHHLCLEVEDITATLDHLAQAGTRLLNETPKQHPDGTQFAFIHPQSTGGVLIELYQLPTE